MLENRRFYPETVPVGAKVFMSLVILGGGMAFLYSLYLAVQSVDLLWLSLLFLAVLASNFTLTLPLAKGKGPHQSVSIAMGDLFVFMAILYFGPPVAVVTAVAESSTMNFRAKVSSLYKQLFNLSQLALSAFAVSHVFYHLMGVKGPLDPADDFGYLSIIVNVSLSALFYFLFNTGLVSVAMVLNSGAPLFQFWKENFAWTWVTQFGGAFVAALAFLFLGKITFAVILGAPTVLLIFLAYKMNVDRVKQAQEHLERTQQLLLEKTKAEEALQKAKEELEIRVAQRTIDLSRANEQLVREIEERIQAEEALANEKDRLAVTLRSLGEGVITADIMGRVVLINDVGEKLSGWSQNEAEGLLLEEVFQVTYSETGKRPRSLVEQALEFGVVRAGQSMALSLTSRSGELRAVSLTAAPILGKGASPIGVVVVFRDVTLQKKMEDELLKAKKMESLGLLAGGIAHDFNNILAGILLKSQMGQRQSGRGKRPEEYLESIEVIAREASDLTQQLLTFARGGAPIKQASAITKLLRESNKFALKEEGLRFVFNIPDGLWGANFDRAQINQVLNNLVVNAEQAMPFGGTITITAANRIIEQSDPVLKLSAGEFVEVSVKDQGVGISPENLQRIFEPYFTTKAHGHGLGLASVYSIVRRHGGNIVVDSVVGNGTKFTFFLPAIREVPAEAPEPEEVVARGTGRILVMDDDEMIQECAEELLEELGYTSVVVGTGEEALEAYGAAIEEDSPFGAVILDLTIPAGMGGKETVEKLRQIDPGVRAVVSSGYSVDPIMANPGEYGFDAVLSKPFTFESLASVLDKLLARR